MAGNADRRARVWALGAPYYGWLTSHSAVSNMRLCSCLLSNSINGAWLSLVERSVRDREVVGSNPIAPTCKINKLWLPKGSHFLWCHTYCPT